MTKICSHALWVMGCLNFYYRLMDSIKGKVTIGNSTRFFECCNKIRRYCLFRLILSKFTIVVLIANLFA